MGELPERLVALGAITRPHGVRGEVRVHRYNPDSAVLLELEWGWLVRGEERRRVEITASRPHGDVVLMRFAGVDAREGAEAMRGFEVCVPRRNLPDLGEDEYYHADLVGLIAVDLDGKNLGTVSGVIQYPSADCLVLTADGWEREVPLLRPYVIELDLGASRVVVDHLDDLEPRRRRK